MLFLAGILFVWKRRNRGNTLGWNSGESSGPSQRSMATTSLSSPSEALDLRNEVQTLQRGIAEMRALREYDAPPLYGQT